MPQTVVGSFQNPEVVNDVVRELEANGFPRNEVRSITEPSTFEVTGVMSFPRLDFETDASRELTRIGATAPEAKSYIEGLRRGGALCFATGSDDDIEAAGLIMNRHRATEIEQVDGAEPRMPVVAHRSMMPVHDSGVLAGRVRQADGGACVFVW